MHNGSLPWFPWYVNDWLASASVRLMTPAQRSGYFELLCWQWQHEECRLPNNPDDLQGLSGLKDDWKSNAAPILKHFSPTDDGCWLRNEKLYALWQEFTEKHRRRVEAGRRSKAASNAPALLEQPPSISAGRVSGSGSGYGYASTSGEGDSKGEDFGEYTEAVNGFVHARSDWRLNAHAVAAVIAEGVQEGDKATVLRAVRHCTLDAANETERPRTPTAMLRGYIRKALEKTVRGLPDVGETAEWLRKPKGGAK